MLAWRDHMRAVEQLRATTINAYLMTVRTFLLWLVTEGELAEAPTARRLRVTPASITRTDVYGAEALGQLATGAQTSTRGRSHFDAVREP
jgi:site-specific recombinase XerC